MIGIYLRLSDEDRKVGESESIAGQRELIQNYINSDITLSNHQTMQFCDDGYSGTNFNRPALTNLLNLVRTGEIKIIIVKDLSRFGRNYIEVGQYLEQIFPLLGVRFIAVNDEYDSTKEFDFLGLGFQNLLHDLYSKDLSNKITTIRHAKAKQGKFITAFAPYGYLKTKEQQLVIDKEVAVIVQKIFDLALQGTPKTHIARMLNSEGILSPLMLRKSRKDNFACNQVQEQSIWTASVVSNILKDRRYVGDAVYGRFKPTKVGSGIDKTVPKEDWIIVENTHEAIIEREQFENVQALFTNRNYNLNKELRPLQGKIKCSFCNHTISPVNKNGKVIYLCKTSRFTEEHNCYTKSILETDLENIVIKYLGTLAEAICAFETNYKEDNTTEISILKNQIKALDIQIKKISNGKYTLYEDYKCGKLDKKSYINKKSDLENKVITENNKKQKFIDQLQLLEEVPKEHEYERKIKYFSPFQTVTRDITNTFIDKIIINTDGSIKIYWKFSDTEFKAL